MAVYDEGGGTGQGEYIPRELYELNPDTGQVEVREFIAPREPPETWRELREGSRPPGTWSAPRPVLPPPPGYDIYGRRMLYPPAYGTNLPPGFSFPKGYNITPGQSYGGIAPAESRVTAPIRSEYVYLYETAKRNAMNDARRRLTEQKRAETGDPNAVLDADELAGIEEQASHSARRQADLQYGFGAVTAPPRRITTAGRGGRSMADLAFALNAHHISEPDAYRAAWEGGFRGKTGDYSRDYRDFLVEKDRIIHQSGVNRGGGFYAPSGLPYVSFEQFRQSAPNGTREDYQNYLRMAGYLEQPPSPIAAPRYSFRPLTRKRILI